jgi:HK97 family phage prohead protease
MKRRAFSIELRADEDGPEGILRGYAAVYGRSYNVGARQTETIKAGAFDEDLATKRTIPVFYGHGWAKGTNEAPIGVAEVSSDGKGLRVDEARLFIDHDSKARSVWMASKEGALREWSVGFVPSEIGHGRNRSDEIIETGELLEVSVVLKGQSPFTEMTEVREASDEDGGEDDTEPTEPGGSEETSDEDETEGAEGEPGNENEDPSGDAGDESGTEEDADESASDEGGEAPEADPEVSERAAKLLARPETRALFASVLVQ